MAYVHWVTLQLARDVDAELANIRTTSRRDITNPHISNVLYEHGPATYTQQTQDVDSMVD